MLSYRLLSVPISLNQQRPTSFGWSQKVSSFVSTDLKRSPQRKYAQWKGYIDEQDDLSRKGPSEFKSPNLDDPWIRNTLGTSHGDLYKGYRFDNARYFTQNRRFLYENWLNPILFDRWKFQDEDVRRAEGIYYRGTFAEDRPEYVTHLLRRRKRPFYRRFHIGWMIVMLLFIAYWWLSNMGNAYYVLDDNWAHHPFVVDRLAFFGLKAREVRCDGNGQFRAVADQLYGDEEMWYIIKGEIAPALEVWTDQVFDGDNTLMDFFAPEGEGFEGFNPKGRHPLRQPTDRDDIMFGEYLTDRDPQLQNPWNAEENRAGWQPRFYWQRQWDRNAWETYLERLTSEYEPGDHLTLIAIATLWKIRINLLTTSPQVPHHKAWMSIDPLYEQEPKAEINLLLNTLGGYVVAYDSLVPADFNGAPAVALDPVKMERRSAVEKLQGQWQKLTAADLHAQLQEQLDRNSVSRVDRQWFHEYSDKVKRFMNPKKGGKPPPAEP